MIKRGEEIIRKMYHTVCMYASAFCSCLYVLYIHTINHSIASLYVCAYMHSYSFPESIMWKIKILSFTGQCRYNFPRSPFSSFEKKKEKKRKDNLVEAKSLLKEIMIMTMTMIMQQTPHFASDLSIIRHRGSTNRSQRAREKKIQNPVPAAIKKSEGE